MRKKLNKNEENEGKMGEKLGKKLNEKWFKELGNMLAFIFL